MRLGEIAQIRTGLVLSRKKAGLDTTKVTYQLLTLKNISEDGMIVNKDFEVFISRDELDDRYFTEEGDVLMRLSQPYTAIYIDQEYRGLLIPSYFAIIKVDQNKVMPQYIAWYLNTFNVKKDLERYQSGSRIPSTNKDVIRKLPVIITSMSMQKILIELYKIHQTEKNLYKNLIKEKEKRFQGMTQYIIKGHYQEDL
ncbi:MULTISPECIES: restriction endonuclease subunit S [Thermoactinomyces]|uniref:Restriction endonuclease subunit S n=1 Tax=Thermoactinomyces vulgaris TaxID=2026 RepID=A0ABS0QHZ4_THEVU|nr:MULTISPECIES: restriction endonuclease subunit S [Thermoactinomyces]KYQ86410.1 restriction endonuclease [Thermoactinomyces sp. AS95]MBA4551896.1 restriction endonuclease subunit S [Thermoactinomyces vulgaris]MBA4597227.1 restriction endonuclease subunit S [Thermoactinomyces vulgaris]MBH8586463.1 restriction endonuclease subunit S [Thermoactinomyces sp. CICC 10520]MBH8588369.1 restriction endonuclease subunit S [Thermoactinomyces vulgaris]